MAPVRRQVASALQSFFESDFKLVLAAAAAAAIPVSFLTPYIS